MHEIFVIHFIMRKKIAGLYDFTNAKLVIQHKKSGEKACVLLSNSSTVLAQLPKLFWALPNKLNRHSWTKIVSKRRLKGSGTSHGMIFKTFSVIRS
jgi:hypothetical protein